MNNKGFSLVEMMITLAISAIIIGAAFGSYTIIARNFQWQSDMKYMSQTARDVVEMITKDIRNAGFRFESSSVISDPVKIYDAGDALDRIEVIYDETEEPYKRVKIEYKLKPYSSNSSRNRLIKIKTDITDPNNPIPIFESPIADHVETLQFEGTKGSCQEGQIVYGCGKADVLVTPIRAEFGTNGRSTCSDNALKIFDLNPATYWDCSGSEYDNSGNYWINLEFANDVRPTKLVLSGSLGGLSGGSFDLSQGEFTTGYQSDGSYDLLGAIEPWGKNSSIGMIFRFYRESDNGNNTEGDGYTCVWIDNTYCEVGELIQGGGVRSNMDFGDRGSSPNHWLGANVHSFAVQPISTMTYNLEEIDGVHDHYLFATSSKWLTIEISDRARYCDYSRGHCDLTDGGGRFIQIPDMKIYGESFDGTIVPTEIMVGLIVRSPNEHGNVERSHAYSIGNYSFTKNDKYLRDFYTTSATIRNLLYQSQ